LTFSVDEIRDEEADDGLVETYDESEGKRDVSRVERGENERRELTVNHLRRERTEERGQSGGKRREGGKKLT